RLLQIFEPGAKQLLCRRAVSSFECELPLKAKAVCIIGAQTTSSCLVFEPGDCSLGDLQLPDPKRNYASAPSYRQTQGDVLFSSYGMDYNFLSCMGCLISQTLHPRDQRKGRARRDKAVPAQARDMGPLHCRGSGASIGSLGIG